MENKEQDQMQIPVHCSKKEFVEGFGKVEFFRAFIFFIIGSIVGVVIFLFKKDITSIILSMVVGGFAGYLFCKKDRYSRTSILDSFIDLLNFNKSQKFYEYKKIYNKEK